ncbi:MAG: TenA family protein [Streptosporangiaceae bacterium]
MSFSEHAWTTVKPWYDAITTHPFIVALTDGSLGRDVFVRYLVDDSHYLLGYASALAAASARVGAPADAALLARSAAAAVEAERMLHRGFLEPLGIDPDGPDASEPSPTGRAYVSTLQVASAFAPVEVAVAGILPCFRVYAEVGAQILAGAPPADHPYRAWIDTYADPEFEQAVRATEALADRLASGTTEDRRAEMLRAYQEATRYEWMFWDAAWRGESWPAA